MQRILYLLLACLMASAAIAADRYEFDKAHTNIVFFINHLGFSNMVGELKQYDGYFEFDEQHPDQSKIDVSINPAGVSTSSPELDKKLQTAEFFNSDKFPTLTFKSTAIEVTGKNTGKVTGNLTMLGVTKPVTLNVTFNKAGKHPYSQDYIAGFSANGMLKRSDFGMKAYIPMVGDEVHFQIETEAVNMHKKVPHGEDDKKPKT